MAVTKPDTDRNAGEWAELYVLLRSLADGKLYAADRNLNKNSKHFFPIIRVQMEKASDGSIINYEVNEQEKIIFVVSENEAKTEIPMDEFKIEALKFFKIISTRNAKEQGKTKAFSVPEIYPFLQKLKDPDTKKSSSNKADIHMVIHDIMTGYEPMVGFSIKSKHRDLPSLINPSAQTLFRYEIVSERKKKVDVNEIRNLLKKFDEKGNKRGPKTRIRSLLNAGYALKFKRVFKPESEENFRIIDSDMDKILGECLKVFFSGSKTSLIDILAVVSNNNPCSYKPTDDSRLTDFYTYKIKRLIVDSALGMRPGSPWTGHYDASGGYIIVKDSGDVICYHLYNWNALQEYLFQNLKFEGPASTSESKSKKPYNYALWREEDGKPCLDLCLQLRFK